MLKNEKSILDVQAMRPNRDHNRYRNPAKSRITEIKDHFIVAKRPFELAIPSTEWDTLHSEIASKISNDDAGKHWVWLQKITEHYAGACSLRQDHYQTSISIDGQRKPKDPPFTPAFVVSQVISFEAAQHTNKLLANSTTEEQVHSTPSTTAHKLVKKLPGRSRPGTFLTDIAFSVAASGNTTVTYAQLQARLADVAKGNGTSRPASHTTTPPGPRRELMTLVEQEEHSYTLPEEGIHIPWAKILPSKTVIPPYDSPPTRPIGQLTLQASKGKFTSNLTFQVIYTDQPALLSTEASIALDVLTLHADFIRKCSISNPPLPPPTEPDSHQESAAGPLPPPPDTSMRVWPTQGT
ncbi:hypothetical protein pdam_00023530 [Pocillopora damicornis]|uniref:Uncharacterized protein n=1 Tax=Pocillopora damicornis TaxID=46731 RepID=A0A3M6TH02_POCDA|nr:hypothetical protein pdam_00023530 [Pocillopora damicornis]